MKGFFLAHVLFSLSQSLSHLQVVYSEAETPQSYQEDKAALPCTGLTPRVTNQIQNLQVSKRFNVMIKLLCFNLCICI